MKRNDKPIQYPLGFTLRVSEKMHAQILAVAKRENRKFNDQVRFFLQLGLEAENLVQDREERLRHLKILMALSHPGPHAAPGRPPRPQSRQGTRHLRRA